jgi:hypothetical protein
MKCACIDVTGGRSMDVVWFEDGGHQVEHAGFKKPADFVTWAKKHHPTVIAIDAPSKPNLGRMKLASVRGLRWKDGKYENYRVCEAMLSARGIGLYGTKAGTDAGWIKRGWEIYEGLIRDGYKYWEEPGPVNVRSGERRLIEVHPHACFVVGLGWVPHSKATLAGLLERAAYLEQQGAKVEGGIVGTCWPSKAVLGDLRDALSKTTWESITGIGCHLPTLDHDTLDALAGLLTALACLNGTSFAVGEPEEGVIVLPSKPLEKYEDCSPQETRTPPTCEGAAPRRSSGPGKMP